MKKKKSIILGITLVSLLIIGVSGYFIGKYYLVNYTFNRYVLNSALEMIKQDNNEEKSEVETKNELEQERNEQINSGDSESGETPEQKSPENESKKANDMTNSQVASIVSRTPALISKLESIVSYGDKERVFNILLSNFTQDEIAHYSKKVAGGMTSADKSELISIARSRITSAQWSECMQMFYKYVDQLKPYIDEAMIN